MALVGSSFLPKATVNLPNLKPYQRNKASTIKCATNRPAPQPKPEKKPPKINSVMTVMRSNEYREEIVMTSNGLNVVEENKQTEVLLDSTAMTIKTAKITKTTKP
ncbi:uncharacterized protein LOC110009711 [Jatropha curcas]|uniref:uncharacterized protein LOC110009711 n=1 Tax=Jatropha curcas TaxID=180498 RepID=UPI0009D699F0|nr:uncharacterized protein LOC110009711 [Jatropha curcas]